jgi:hypothetical protein
MDTKRIDTGSGQKVPGCLNLSGGAASRVAEAEGGG